MPSMTVISRVPHAGDRLLAIAAMNDHFGHQRVVVGRNGALGVRAGVDAPGPPGTLKAWITPGEGRKVSGSSALTRHSIAWPVNVISLCFTEPFAGGNADLLLHDVDASDHLGDRVLHLQPRIHFHEVEAPAGIHQELERSGVGGWTARAASTTTPTSAAHLVGQCHRRRLLDQLLMPPLNGALPLAQVHHTAARSPST